ncbi:MAG: hypothetical protein QG612_1325 [Pseudomonadota bacterium]|nr:hypothetical protein [Pseudomonadota bacterium]
MRPDKLSVPYLFQKSEQYMIPLFQRGYVWTLRDQILPLWEDLIDRMDALTEFKNNSAKVGSKKLKTWRKHFLGTVVVGEAKGGGREAVPAREVIDGQQRITTLQILLLALRDVVRPLQDEWLDDELKLLTRNRGRFSDTRHALKVWPTHVGRDVMQALAHTGLNLETVCTQFPARGAGRVKFERPLMVQAYLFFHVMLTAHLRGIRHDDPAVEPDSESLSVAETVIHSIEQDNAVWQPQSDQPLQVNQAHLLFETLKDGFQIMWLELEDEDDPQIIFETLNARGAPLQPSDLIRNYLFLQATRKQENVDLLYDQHWRPFDEKPAENNKTGGERFWRQDARQGRVKSVRLDLLLHHVVALRKCTDLKAAHVFEEFKDWWLADERDTASELERISTLGRYFEQFLQPIPNSALGRFCRRMQLLDTATLTPLVFYFLEHHPADSAEMAQVLRDLESYVVRRFICGETTKGYTRIFINKLLADLAQAGSYSAADLRTAMQSLKGDSQYWLDDDTFHRAWCNRALYRGRNSAQVRALLEALEFSLNSDGKQEFNPLLENNLTVEHVMPQKWQTHWPLAASDKTNSTDETETIARRERLLQSIGNLTLVTARFNATLSNEAFAVKRPEITDSSLLRLNAYFQRMEGRDWDEAAILARSEALFVHARKIWPGPA